MNLYPDSSNLALMSCLVIAKGSNSTITVFVILFISIFLIPFLSFNCFSMIGLHVGTIHSDNFKVGFFRGCQ